MTSVTSGRNSESWSLWNVNSEGDGRKGVYRGTEEEKGGSLETSLQWKSFSGRKIFDVEEENGVS